jgi:hypothetical protein
MFVAKQMFSLVVLISIGFCCGRVLANSWDTVLLRDDFDISSPNMPDPNIWIVNNPDSWWWLQGRTFFPSPFYHIDANFPEVVDGNCLLEHHTFNSFHKGTPKTTFLGGEMHSIRKFGPTTAYRFEARLRCNSYPGGLVTSFFLYGHDGSKSDEIDFEFVSNKTNDDVNYVSGDPVLVNTWNESFQDPCYVEVNTLDLSNWNTFRIYWDPNLTSVKWTWLDPDKGETLLREETNAFFIPDEPMALYFNFWAPTFEWPAAFDENLKPANDPCENEILKFEIDYVEVRSQGPACGDPNHLNPSADLDFDCDVDEFDLSIFVFHWLETPCISTDACGCADILDDGIVDFKDYALLAEEYMENTAP